MAFVYDRVETNYGNGYDVQSGNFTAPERSTFSIPARLRMTNLTAR